MKRPHPAGSSAKPRKRSARLLARVARGTLFAVSLQAAQLLATEARATPRIFGADLLDRLTPPLTRYHD